MKIFLNSIILSLFISLGFVNGQELSYEFRKLPKGISNNQIQAIHQDAKGFMWFGTRNGLNRFDGINYITFQKDIKDSTSLSGSEIKHILELDNEDFLISTHGGGVNYFNRSKGTFQEIDLGVELSRRDINQVLKDEEGNYWVATESDGIIQLDAEFQLLNHWYSGSQLKGNIIRLFIDADETGIWFSDLSNGIAFIDKNQEMFYFTSENSELPGDMVISVGKSALKNHYWLGFERNGVALVELNKNSISVKKHYSTSTDSDVQLANEKVFSVLEDNQRRVWVGAENAGLYIIDNENDTSYHFTNDKQNPLSLGGNSIWSIFQDKSNSVWLGVFNQSVNVVHENFNKFRYINSKPNSINNNSVNTFLEHKDGNLWIGTDGGGINIYNRKENTFSTITTKTPKPWQLSSDAILDMTYDAEGNIWVGTWGGGIDVVTKNGIINYKKSKDYQITKIFSIEKSHDNTLWFQEFILDDTTAIRYYNPKTNSIENSGIIVPNNLVLKLLEDSQKNLWIGSTNGLYMVPFDGELQKDAITSFAPSEKEGSLSSDAIQDIFEDSKGQIWIATADGGVNKYISATKSFQVITERDGLLSNTVQAIEEDQSGNLWISTNKGISKYDIQENTFEHFTSEDGLQEGSFLKKSVFKSSNNELFFGGVNGFNFFDPNKLPYNNHVPSVQFTNLSILNESVKPGENGVIEERAEFAKSVTLSYKNQIFSIEFVALNYIRSENNRYQYKLEGFNDKWIDIENQRKITFTGIPHGNYILHVKGANNDGLWNEEPATIKIIIIPPWWDTLLAKIIFGICMVGLFFTFYYVRTVNLEKQKKLLENKVRERTAELHEKQQEVIVQNEELRQSQEELEAQRDYIEEKNKDLQDKNTQINQSIVAAQRIQEAILPSDAKLSELFKEYFIFYRPRDIVSGDFYWLSSRKGRTDSTWIVAADCTGHGVPGAFMTLLGGNILDQLINTEKVETPAEVMKRLNISVRETLRQEENEVNMGMDLMVIKIPKEQTGDEVVFQFAGAKSQIYIFDAITKELNVYKGDRITIGGLHNKKEDFTNHNLSIPKNSTIYMASDGYQDQNNEGRVRLGSKKLKEILKSNTHLSLKEQSDIFETVLANHMGGTEQRDDILLMGLKL